MSIYEVGGFVRDFYLEVEPKDRDFVMEAKSFEELRDYVQNKSKTIFLEKPDFGIIRYMSVDGNPEDISFCDTIKDDLAQRDFTMNAIARNIQSQVVIDPFHGRDDIKHKIIRCTGAPEEILEADPARIIRAIRFKIELEFEFDEKLSNYLYLQQDFDCLKTLNPERLRQELDKCFKYSSSKALREFHKLGDHFLAIVFDHHKLKLLVK